MGKKTASGEKAGESSKETTKKDVIVAKKKTSLDIVRRSEDVNMGLQQNTAKNLVRIAGGPDSRMRESARVEIMRIVRTIAVDMVKNAVERVPPTRKTLIAADLGGVTFE